MIVVIVFMDEEKTNLRENKMTKEDYLQLKKEFKIRFTIIIVPSYNC